jgi:hypothetical protein
MNILATLKILKVKYYQYRSLLLLLLFLWLIMTYSKRSMFIGWIEVSSAKVAEHEEQRWLVMSPENCDVECEAVTNFREYLRIPSVQPDVNYGMWYWNMDVIIRQAYY